MAPLVIGRRLSYYTYLGVYKEGVVAFYLENGKGNPPKKAK